MRDIVYSERRIDMLNKAKEFYGDYKKMVVEPEKEFYRKHWVGVTLINAVPITLFFAAPSMCSSVAKLKDKLSKKDNSIKIEEIEVDNRTDFEKHVDETIAMVNGRQGS